MTNLRSIPKPKVSADIEGRYLVLKFKWALPSKVDKATIQEMTHQMEYIVDKAGGTHGQMNAVSKDFRDAGFYIKGPKR